MGRVRICGQLTIAEVPFVGGSVGELRLCTVVQDHRIALRAERKSHVQDLGTIGLGRYSVGTTEQSETGAEVLHGERLRA